MAAVTPARVYFSDRGLPLTYHGGPPRRPTLAVECYLKWYHLYVVRTTGRVTKLSARYAERYERDRPGDVAWGDHKPYPGFCRWLATYFEWDTTALELCIGRWEWERDSEAAAAFLPADFWGEPTKD